jgi:hypothetical protein
MPQLPPGASPVAGEKLETLKPGWHVWQTLLGLGPPGL